MKKYQIYDGENSTPLFEDDTTVEARTAKEAIEIHLLKTNRVHKLRRSGGRDAMFKAQPFYEENGRKYRDGNIVWYAKV